MGIKSKSQKLCVVFRKQPTVLYQRRCSEKLVFYSSRGYTGWEMEVFLIFRKKITATVSRVFWFFWDNDLF